MTNSPTLGIWGPDPGAGTELWEHWENQNESIEQQLQTWHERVAQVRNTAGGGGLTTTGDILLAPASTIPPNPFGPGIPYSIEVAATATCDCPSATGFNVLTRVRPAGSPTWDIRARLVQANAAPGTARLSLTVVGTAFVADPSVGYETSASIRGDSTVTVINQSDWPQYVVTRVRPAQLL